MSSKGRKFGTAVDEGPKGSKGEIQDHGVNLLGPKNRNEEIAEKVPLSRREKGNLS
jgi:predicted RecA/RadA family phage recombinase